MPHDDNTIIHILAEASENEAYLGLSSKMQNITDRRKKEVTSIYIYLDTFVVCCLYVKTSQVNIFRPAWRGPCDQRHTAPVQPGRGADRQLQLRQQLPRSQPQLVHQRPGGVQEPLWMAQYFKDHSFIHDRWAALRIFAKTINTNHSDIWYLPCVIVRIA